MHTEDQYAAIQEIHDLLADSRKNYEAAAHRVPDEHVKQLLHAISAERDQLETELADDLRQHDPKAKPGNGTAGGTLHRLLLEFRDALNSTSEVNVLVECERQESDLLGRYNKVLDSVDLNENSRATLTGQHAEIEKNVGRIHQLRTQLESVEH